MPYIPVEQRIKQSSTSRGYVPVEQRINRPQPQAQASSVLPNVKQVAEAIAQIESSGRYNAMGPKTRTGDRAYGKYQVMGANIHSWTKQALGYSMTPQQFINNPKAQDAVAYNQMGKTLQQYKDPRQVASIWFSGRPMKGNVAQDVTGTSVPTYISRFEKALGSYSQPKPSHIGKGYIPVEQRYANIV